jgi:thiosulfate/3-mercaptopyruvate sulfurtransferase
MSTILSALAVVAASSGLLVSADELAALLKDPAVVVVAVDSSADNFTAGHIPGARLVLYHDIAPDIGGLQSELPPVETLRRVLAGAGITDRSKVILYGSTIAATRMFFTLDYFGHPNARVLNGGLAAWKARGGPIEVSPPPAVTAYPLTPKPQPDRVVSADWIMERLSTPTLRHAEGRPDPSTSSGSPRATSRGERSRGAKIRLLDARPDPEYTGSDGGMGGMHVVGHLPEAQQLVWNTLLDSTGKFLPDAELRKKYEAIGASKDTPLVSYCLVGMRASVTYFVARHLGYDARMYDGSIVDWSRRKLPAVQGR